MWAVQFRPQALLHSAVTQKIGVKMDKQDKIMLYVCLLGFIYLSGHVILAIIRGAI